ADRRAAGGRRDEAADDEAIAGQRAERGGLREPELGERGVAGRELRDIDERERREHLRRRVMDEHLAARGQRSGGRPQVAELDVEDVRAGDLARVGDQIAARELVDSDAAEVERRAMAGERTLDRRAVDLDAA